MLREIFGKIESAEFGVHPEYPRLMGLMIVLKYGEKGFVKDNRRMCHKTSRMPDALQGEMDNMMNEVLTLLKEANVNNVSDLKGTPVEIVFYDDRYMGFKIRKIS